MGSSLFRNYYNSFYDERLVRKEGNKYDKKEFI